jgi:NAD(P)-dependent dehydrogenase (short-subunit alcohol dehydrogenase family)
MGDLKGKVAVVTGASKGIGAPIAKLLSAAGAAVVVNYSSSKEDAEAGSSVSPQQRISPSKESRTTQIENPKPQENGMYTRLSCKIDHLLRSNHRA